MKYIPWYYCFVYMHCVAVKFSKLLFLNILNLYLAIKFSKPLCLLNFLSNCGYFLRDCGFYIFVILYGYTCACCAVCCFLYANLIAEHMIVHVLTLPPP